MKRLLLGLLLVVVAFAFVSCGRFEYIDSEIKTTTGIFRRIKHVHARTVKEYDFFKGKKVEKEKPERYEVYFSWEYGDAYENDKNYYQTLKHLEEGEEIIIDYFTRIVLHYAEDENDVEVLMSETTRQVIQDIRPVRTK